MSKERDNERKTPRTDAPQVFRLSNQLLVLKSDYDRLRAEKEAAERAMKITAEVLGRMVARAEKAESQLAAERRDAEILRKAITEHNAGCLESCAARDRQDSCDPYTKRGRTCVDCPRDWMIDDIALPLVSTNAALNQEEAHGTTSTPDSEASS